MNYCQNFFETHISRKTTSRIEDKIYLSHTSVIVHVFQPTTLQQFSTLGMCGTS